MMRGRSWEHLHECSGSVTAEQVADAPAGFLWPLRSVRSVLHTRAPSTHSSNPDIKANKARQTEKMRRHGKVSKPKYRMVVA